MRGITTPKMCELAGMNFQRFETLRHRQRKALEPRKAPDHMDRIDMAEAGLLPLGNVEYGKWVRYSFGDTLRLAVAVALEKGGVEFSEAASFSAEVAGFFQHPAGAGDFWIMRTVMQAPEDVDVFRGHPTGDRNEVARRLDAERDLVAGIILNVSAIARRVKIDAAKMGLAVDGDRFVAGAEDA